MAELVPDPLDLALAAFDEGRHAAAETLCRHLLAMGRGEAQVHFLLGMVLHRLARDAEAVGHLGRAAELAPTEARIFHGLGCAYHTLGDFRQAVTAYDRAMELEPAQADLYYGCGNARYQVGDFTGALSAYQKGLGLNPGDADLWHNLGKSLHELNRIAEAVAAYDRAVELAPDRAEAHYARALALLADGRLREGFREAECRWRLLPSREFSGPRWQGETVPEATLFLHAEQGFGDAIQMVRLVRLARERVARVVLECRPELKTLFAHSGCADTVIAVGEPIPNFDRVASLQSLPAILGITVEDLPGPIPYLVAPAGEPLSVAPDHNIKAGLVWAGNPGHHNDTLRSLTLAQLAPVLQTAGIEFLSLQVPVPERDGPQLPEFPRLEQLGSRLTDFAATAAVIAQLNLVITVDTAVAHLAGALGRPVWTLLQHSPDWRWPVRWGERTPWYPTMRLFRQMRRGDWSAVVERVAAELAVLALSSGRNAEYFGAFLKPPISESVMLRSCFPRQRIRAAPSRSSNCWS